MLVLTLLGACRADEPVQASPRPSAPVKPTVEAMVATPALLVAAAAQPPAGGFTMTGKARMALEEKAAVIESLDEETRLERTAAGVLHGVYGNSRDHGREFFADGTTLWIRPRFGKFHRRPLGGPDEAPRLVAETWGTLAAQLELVLAGCTLEHGGHRVTLARGDGKLAGAGWREGARLESVSGVLELDDDGVLVSGRLDAVVVFRRDGKPLTMRLFAEQSRGPAAAAVTLPAEEDSAPTPVVSTEFADRAWLLSGIAPPPRKSPAPPGKDTP